MLLSFVQLAINPAHQIPIECPLQHQDGERFAHSGPDKLLGIRIEDEVLVTRGAPEVLTGALEKTPDAIESLR